MDYLKEQFHLDLAEEENTYAKDGRVFIMERHWSPEDILQVMSDELYGEVFSEWMDERKGDLIQVAEEILEKYDNKDRFASLKKNYQRGIVIPFVGAGMSTTSGYPAWSEYLRNVCTETHILVDDLNKMLSDGQYEEAAQDLYDDMGAPSFNEHLNNKFGNERQPLGPVNYLPYIFKSGVITTNFDPVLETVYKNKEPGFDEIMLGPSAEMFPRLIATGRAILLKLHGHGDRLKDRVLTLDEYNHAYSDEGILNNLVEHAFFNKTMLFLGCSLSVDRTIQLMTKYVKEKGHENLPRHYAFIKLREGEDRLARREQLVAANIFPIWYEDIEHDEAIEALLLYLADGVVEI